MTFMRVNKDAVKINLAMPDPSVNQLSLGREAGLKLGLSDAQKLGYFVYAYALSLGCLSHVVCPQVLVHLFKLGQQL
jgi:hypothetical protein